MVLTVALFLAIFAIGLSAPLTEAGLDELLGTLAALGLSGFVALSTASNAWHLHKKIAISRFQIIANVVALLLAVAASCAEWSVHSVDTSSFFLFSFVVLMNSIGSLIWLKLGVKSSVSA